MSSHLLVIKPVLKGRGCRSLFLIYLKPFKEEALKIIMELHFQRLMCIPAMVNRSLGREGL